jgi:hypothetical protein
MTSIFTIGRLIRSITKNFAQRDALLPMQRRFLCERPRADVKLEAVERCSFAQLGAISR